METNPNKITIVKASGEVAQFSLAKLKKSLKRTGADDTLVSEIIEIVQGELYEGITTKEIYNRAFALLKKKKNVFASKYKLKKAIYELGPTGYPFEYFIAAVLKYSGYKVKVGEILQGECVQHEVDVLAHKNNETTVVECKFHSEQGFVCNVKVPLYIHSRYNDVRNYWNTFNKHKTTLTQGWVVTNTRFTEDATQYGNCAGLYLLSWDYPKENSLKDIIDRLGLYPITVSTLLTKREKQFLLNRDVVLCRELIKDSFYLDHLGVSDTRKSRILLEIQQLCSA
ncbi:MULTISPECIES: restriction endonuclease [Tenacibaculum]|uniref:ATPase n=1 Tax=Tenacibaculum discolor TaxID=361581 RepID=A0A2G1BUJ7_9FLAO|nr:MULTISPECIES: restriction endonuclease [Tenacibaculum]PHO00629.1 ATPase [Rhodobacteraceae bacterium 4F10]MDP2542713.1 restriction endonuclease [Tenacibaculum discolor]NVK10330.1 restriction endonuclease [Tenacibaculum sp.]PHN97712.1 ATPase [Tenacibaculum discolor]RLJ96881.1 ATP cone domain-containing protein [Tenacibaculum discolor]